MTLVSSNTRDIIQKTLSHIKIDSCLFDTVIGSDTGFVPLPFTKRKAFAKLVSRLPSGERMLSIGDRYATDIEPMLVLGHDGVLLASPQALPQLLKDMRAGTLSLCGYHFFDGGRP